MNYPTSTRTLSLAIAGLLTMMASSALADVTPYTSVTGSAAASPDNASSSSPGTGTYADRSESYTINPLADVFLDQTAQVSADPQYGSSVAGLTDGVILDISTGYDAGDPAYGSSATYQIFIPLATPSNLSEIQTIAGFSDDRIGQIYTVSYTTVADPTLDTSSSDFTTIGSVNFGPGGPLYDGGGSSSDSSQTEVIFANGGASITGGQDATGILFSLTTPAESTASGAVGPLGTVYEEFAAYDVPEPSTWAMLLGGAGILIVVQRCRRLLSNS